jgi:hypothetical protein
MQWQQQQQQPVMQRALPKILSSPPAAKTQPGCRHPTFFFQRVLLLSTQHGTAASNAKLHWRQILAVWKQIAL